MADASRRRFHELDAFRGIAALWVVLFHFVMRYQHADMPFVMQVPWAHSLDLGVRAWLPNFGIMPVAWFFMISGFVMTWTLERSRTWQDFAVSRAARLYPVYWAALAVVVVMDLLIPLPGQRLTLLQCLVNLTMIQEIIGVPHLRGGFWSLTIELVFYVGMAALLRLGLIGHLHAICAIWVIACIGTQLLPLVGIEVFWRVQKYGLLIYGHFLIAGIMFYQMWQGRRSAVALLVIFLCLVSVALANTAVTSVVYALFFAMAWLAIRGHLAFLANPPLIWLGSISYALYVAHEGLGFRLMYGLESLGVPRLASIAAAIAMSLVVADLLTRLVDPRGRRLVRAALTRRPVPIPAPAPDR